MRIDYGFAVVQKGIKNVFFGKNYQTKTGE